MSLAGCPDSACVRVEDLGSPNITSGVLDGSCADGDSRSNESGDDGGELHDDVGVRERVGRGV